jgi:hypothetical protein
MSGPSQYVVALITYLIYRIYFSSHSAYMFEKEFTKKEIIDIRITLIMFVITSLNITSLFIIIIIIIL